MDLGVCNSGFLSEGGGVVKLTVDFGGVFGGVLGEVLGGQPVEFRGRNVRGSGEAAGEGVQVGVVEGD